MDDVLRMGAGNTELCQSILLSTKEVIEGKSVEELVKHFHIPDRPHPGSLNNYQARIWYTWKKKGIAGIIEKISGLEEKSTQGI